ncbi:hypothetical protein N494_04220 [Clostridium botulinum A2B7 92]|uniref:hypothetical protein n=1 Tax=Clostridium botulinum TaxID=1491 RepID=UPI0007DEA497|nr:hypothetical protein [Clostridium botulinum]KEJ00206.1 hypothetical protein N494_04220 [Clostridium botulinum A2B7 92]
MDEYTLFFLKWLKEYMMQPKIGTAEILIAIIGSGAISAVITGLFNIGNRDRNIEIKNITDERTKWREKIRHLSIAFAKEANVDKRKAVRNEIAVNLNPTSGKSDEGEDNKIIILMDYIINNGGKKTLRYCINKSENDAQYKKAKAEDIFIIMIQWLLKHDWERSKYESKAWLGKICNIRKTVIRPCIYVNYENH